jgi:hypothetical protein
MNNMMKVDKRHPYKDGSNCTTLLPRKIATPAIIRPSKYRRKDVEDIERRRTISALQARCKKKYTNLVQNNRRRRRRSRGRVIVVVVSVEKL